MRDAEQFCDLNCTWLDHHPDCTVPVGCMGFSQDGHKNKFRTRQFGNSVPVYAHPPSYEKLKAEIDQARQIITDLVEYAEQNDPGCPHLAKAKGFLSGGES